MRKRGLCCRPVSVGLSVCLSVTFVHCIQIAKDIVKLPYRPGSPIIVVFSIPSAIPNSKGNPFSRGAKYTGWENFCDFRRKSPSISETVRDRPIWLLWNINRKSHALYRMVTFSMTLTDPSPGFQDHGIFQVENLKNGQSYYRTLTGNHTNITLLNGTTFNDLD